MVTVEELRVAKIFSSLGESDLARLAQKAADIRLAPGEWLIREGEPPWFYVMLEGQFILVKDVLGRQQNILEYQYKRGDFFGEVPILLGTLSLISLQATAPCRVARFDQQQFRYLIQSSKEISALVLQTMNERVIRVQDYAAAVPVSRVKIVGTQYDTDCRDIRTFLSANRIPYKWVDVEHEQVPACMPKNFSIPTVIVDGQGFMRQPTLREVADALQLQTQPKHDYYDVVIVGAGPAGMAASVYGASEGLRVLVVERFAAGGQAGTSTRIENYLGFPEGVSGDDLTGRALKQAIRFGAEIAMTRCVESLRPADGCYTLALDGGKRVTARAIVLATGVDWRRLLFEGADRLLGRGILYGASRTEAINVNGRKVVIIGGGNSAGQAAMFFSDYAADIKVLVRGEGLNLSMSQYLIGQIASKSNIQVVPFTQIVAAEGGDCLEGVVVRTRPPGSEETLHRYDADALFILIGADASTGWLPEELERDEKGYICTGRDLATWGLEREPFPLETSLPGVFCAGDVRHNSIKRVSSAVGEGSMSIAFIHQYLALQENFVAALSA